MQIAVRSYLTAGVAMMGATALIAAPITTITTPPPDIQVPAIYSAQINLAAASNPITPWLNVFEDTFTNVVGIGTAVASDPAPALRQLIINALGYGDTVVTGLTGTGESIIKWATENVPTSLKAVANNLAQGNVTVAAQEVNNLIVSVLLAAFPLFDILAIPSKIVDSFGRVVTTLTSLDTVLPLVSGVLSPVMSVVAALGGQGQAFVDALGQGHVLGALGALINIPAAVTGAFLNGYEDSYPGLLTYLPHAPGASLIGALLVTIPKAIADALKPPAAARSAVPTTDSAMAGAAALPDVNAPTLTLDAPADTAADAPKTEVESASNVVETEQPVTVEPTVTEESTEDQTVTAGSDVTTEATDTDPGAPISGEAETPAAESAAGGDPGTTADVDTPAAGATEAPIAEATTGAKPRTMKEFDASVKKAADNIRSEAKKAGNGTPKSLRGGKPRTAASSSAASNASGSSDSE